MTHVAEEPREPQRQPPARSQVFLKPPPRRKPGRDQKFIIEQLEHYIHGDR
jgi:hypothetical protein